MARTSMIIAGVVLVLGLISVGAGFAAEATRVKGSQMRIDPVEWKCVHPPNPVMGLAITAAVALFLLRVVIRVATGRGYACCRTHPNLPKLIKLCIFLAWLMSFAAFGAFIVGAKDSTKKDVVFTNGVYGCPIIKPGYFSGASLAALLNLGLSLFYYLVIASSQNVPNKPSESEVEVPSVTKDHLIPPLPPQMP